MKFYSALSFALKNLRRRKLRTVLTVFAILIGTTLISSMVSLGVGLQQIVVKGLKSTGELTDINVYQKETGKALDAVFNPSLSLEQNVKRCLQYIGGR